MAAKKKQSRCENCKRLEKRLANLESKLSKVMDELARAKKNSSNSSKPPSGDIVNLASKGSTAKSRQDATTKRKRGGQPGHPRHQRPAFPPDAIDNTWIYYYTGCPCCGGKLIDAEIPDKVLQQVEIQDLPIQVQEHRRPTQRCVQCDKLHCVGWPEDLKKAGLVGPRLTALVGYCKSACNMSFTQIRKFLRDVVKVTISRGQLRKLVAKVADSVLDPYEQLLSRLPREEQLDVDETGHKENGKRLWTWCFRATLYTVYKISPSRGSEVLVEVLPLL